MDTIKLTDVKTHLSALIDRVEAGDTIAITRRGKVVARLTSAVMPRKRIDMNMLATLTASLLLQAPDAADLVRSMRDDERF